MSVIAEPTELTVEHADGALHIVDRAGEEPAIVLMHGFPDDHHIYDRLAPLLAPRRVIAFDWLGYGRSSRREKGAFDRTSRQQDLNAVIDLLGLHKVVLVGHDASGPEAITFALRWPEQVTHLVLLNTYYGRGDGLRFPEMIRLFADPELIPLADAIVEDPQQRLWLLTHSAKQFGMYPLKPDGLAASSILAQYFGSERQRDALTEIRAWTGDLFGALDAQGERVAAGDLGRLAVPTTLIFGARDSYLSAPGGAAPSRSPPELGHASDSRRLSLAAVGPARGSGKDHQRRDRQIQEQVPGRNEGGLLWYIMPISLSRSR